MSEVCNDVCLESTLQPVTGEQLRGATANTEDGARLDIAANGFWGSSFEHAFFDVQVFNPLAPSNRQQNPANAYKKHERVKIHNAFVKSNMDPSLPWSCLSQVVWVMLQTFASKGWPPYLLPSMTQPLQQHPSMDEMQTTLLAATFFHRGARSAGGRPGHHTKHRSPLLHPHVSPLFHPSTCNAV